MTWMLTVQGIAFDLVHIDPRAIEIDDIAHSLATKNRYNGHAVRPISVAEHSLLVVNILQRTCKVQSPSVLLAGLLHDAHEAYTGDLHQPMKQVIDRMTNGAWKREERRIQQAVLKRFNVMTAFHGSWTTIHLADMKALATEKRDLMHELSPEWEALEGVDPVDWVKLPQTEFITWRDWRSLFLAKYRELVAARAQQVEDLGRTDTPANDGSAGEGAAAA